MSTLHRALFGIWICLYLWLSTHVVDACKPNGKSSRVTIGTDTYICIYLGPLNWNTNGEYLQISSTFTADKLSRIRIPKSWSSMTYSNDTLMQKLNVTDQVTHGSGVGVSIGSMGVLSFQRVYREVFSVWSDSPTFSPTFAPSGTPEPSSMPSSQPSIQPSSFPSLQPSSSPSSSPTVHPIKVPTKDPTISPTPLPSTIRPSELPTIMPTPIPTTSVEPTIVPTIVPTQAPTESPTMIPTIALTDAPSTGTPTMAPSIEPTTLMPTAEPTPSPTVSPTVEPTTNSPTTESPSQIPSPNPSHGPTDAPSEVPSKVPSETPSELPSESPTEGPTEAPTAARRRMMERGESLEVEPMLHMDGSLTSVGTDDFVPLANSTITFPILFAIIVVDHGKVKSVIWDNMCQWCSPSKCLPNTLDYNNEKVDDSAGNCFVDDRDCPFGNQKNVTSNSLCELTVYISWTGTDSTGANFVSAASRFSRWSTDQMTTFTDKLKTEAGYVPSPSPTSTTNSTLLV